MICAEAPKRMTDVVLQNGKNQRPSFFFNTGITFSLFIRPCTGSPSTPVSMISAEITISGKGFSPGSVCQHELGKKLNYRISPNE
jgi:hypothetical protein